jgi:hypothetical protein
MKLWNWIKKKWKIIAGVVVGFFALLGIMIRNRMQKSVLDNANKAHEAENKVNDKAREDLVTGLTEITKEKDKKLADVNNESDEAERKLAEEKEKFIEDVSESDDLARKIAEHIGAEFIDANDE